MILLLSFHFFTASKVNARGNRQHCEDSHSPRQPQKAKAECDAEEENIHRVIGHPVEFPIAGQIQLVQFLKFGCEFHPTDKSFLGREWHQRKFLADQPGILPVLAIV